MTELQMGLLGLGATAVVGILAYNQWQEYRHRKLAEKALAGEHSDVLLDAPVREAAGGDEAPTAKQPFACEDTHDAPVFAQAGGGLDESGERAERAEPRLRLEPHLGLPEEASPQVLAPEPERAGHGEAGRSPEAGRPLKEMPLPAHLLSASVDYIAAFETVESAPAYQILGAQRDVLTRLHKPVHWVGFNEHSREWEPIVDPGGRDGGGDYRRIRVGLQLADRHGPVTESDLSHFHLAMHDLSDELMAVADMPPRQSALDAAAQLDQFCASVDIQIGINVIARHQPFPGTKLRALAEASGMVLDGDGRFVRSDDEGRVLYLMLNHDAAGFSAESMRTMSSHGLTFLLDVPRVAHGERVLNQMIDQARRFADTLQGDLVDDNRHPLPEKALEPIRRQVAQFQAAMAAHQLPAGGPLALRLFA